MKRPGKRIVVTGSARRGVLAGFLLVLALSWTLVRLGAVELRTAGRQAFWSGRLRDALHHYRWAERLSPGDLGAEEGEREVYVSALEGPPALLAQLGFDSDEAARSCGEDLAELVEAAPLNPESWSGISEFYGALKTRSQQKRAYSLDSISARPEENLEPEDVVQIRALERSVEVDPNGVYYLDTLGDLAWGLGLRTLSAAVYRDAVAIAPSLDSHPFLSAEHPPPELVTAAIEGLKAALRRKNAVNREDVYRNLGGFEMQMGRFSEAREAFRGAESLNRPGYYLYFQGYAEDRAGRSDEAVRLYQKALAHEMDPGTQYQTELSLAGLLEQMGRHQEAADHLRAALILRPRDPRALVALGRICESLGLLEEAEDQYVRAARSNVDRIALLVNLVAFYRRVGRPDQALVPARELMELQPGEEVYRQQLAQIQEEINRAVRY